MKNNRTLIFLELEDYTNVGVEVNFYGDLDYLARTLVEKYNNTNDVVELINKSDSVIDLTPEADGKIFAASSIEDIQNLEIYVYNQDNDLQGKYNNQGHFIPETVRNIETKNYDYLCVFLQIREWLVSYNVKDNYDEMVKCEFENLEANIIDF